MKELFRVPGPLLSLVLAAAALGLGPLFAITAAAPAGDQEGDYVKDVEGWRNAHEERYTQEYVPLAGLFALTPGANTVGSETYSNVLLPKRAPAKVGVIMLQRDGRLFFQPNWSGAALLNGKRLTGPVPLKSDAKGEPDELVIPPNASPGAVDPKTAMAIWVHDSGPHRMVRLRDPEGEEARAFQGFRWFPIDQKYRVIGRIVKDPAPKTLQVANFLGDQDEYLTEGVVEFTLLGKQVRLRPFTEDTRFFFVFKDETSGKETYEAARFLYADIRPDGTAVLDFNEAYNPPCAFNPFTTCPIPLPENRLGLRILAGEKAYPNSPAPPKPR